MNLKEIRELLNLVAEKDISELELERAGVRLRIKRGANSANPHAEIFPPGPAVHPERVFLPEPARAPQTPALPAQPPPEREAPSISTENLHLVKSPIVGTFFSAPAPDAPPFVQVGDFVETGKVLCVIEAMKLMNEIEADVAGEIVKCYVTNGQPVEYGEMLFSIRPRKKK